MSEDEEGPEEDPKERLNRKLIELLNEVRVALPGVQVLFAFLLVLPFSQGFEEVTDLQKGVYAFAFGCAAIASVLLIGCSAYHRHRWRQLDEEAMDAKEEMLVSQDRFVVGGLMLIALAISGVVFLIFDVLFSTSVAVLSGGVMVIAFAWLWYGLPLLRRGKESRRNRPSDAERIT